MTLYHLNVFVHVLAAVVWLGGMFFLAAVGAPVIRTLEPAGLRRQLFESIGRQFRGLGWLAIAVLLATGIGNIHFRGLLTAEVWTGPDFWLGTNYGRTLAAKLVLVTAMVAVQALHDFWLGPAAGRAEPGTPQTKTLRRWASWMARGNALLGVALLWVAVGLARGG